MSRLVRQARAIAVMGCALAWAAPAAAAPLQGTLHVAGDRTAAFTVSGVVPTGWTIPSAPAGHSMLRDGNAEVRLTLPDVSGLTHASARDEVVALLDDPLGPVAGHVGRLGHGWALYDANGGLVAITIDAVSPGPSVIVVVPRTDRPLAVIELERDAARAFARTARIYYGHQDPVHIVTSGPARQALAQAVDASSAAPVAVLDTVNTLTVAHHVISSRLRAELDTQQNYLAVTDPSAGLVDLISGGQDYKLQGACFQTQAVEGDAVVRQWQGNFDGVVPTTGYDLSYQPVVTHGDERIVRWSMIGFRTRAPFPVIRGSFTIDSADRLVRLDERTADGVIVATQRIAYPAALTQTPAPTNVCGARVAPHATARSQWPLGSLTR